MPPTICYGFEAPGPESLRAVSQPNESGDLHKPAGAPLGVELRDTKLRPEAAITQPINPRGTLGRPPGRLSAQQLPAGQQDRTRPNHRPRQVKVIPRVSSLLVSYLLSAIHKEGRPAIGEGPWLSSWEWRLWLASLPRPAIGTLLGRQCGRPRAEVHFLPIFSVRAW